MSNKKNKSGGGVRASDLPLAPKPIPEPLQQHVWGQKISYNAHIRHISFHQWPWEQSELNSLAESLTKQDLFELYYKNGVDVLDLQNIDFTASITETLVKILKGNHQIKHIRFTWHTDGQGIPIDCFARFCDGMEYYHFKTLELYQILSVDHLQLLAEGIQLNQSITELQLTNQTLNNDLFQEICNVLNNCSTISSLKLWSNDTDFKKRSYRSFSEVIGSNKLKSLKISTRRLDFDYLADALKTNTSIEELALTLEQANYEVLGEILLHNNSIKKFVLEGTRISEESVRLLNLSKNKSIVELHFLNCYAGRGQFSPGIALFQELQSNTTVRKLVYNTNSQAVYVKSLKEFLRTNKTLTELELPRGNSRNEKICKYVSKGLKKNSTLRKLTFDLVYQDFSAVQQFLEDLKSNTSLTYLNIGKLTDIGIFNRQENLTNPQYLAVDLVKANNSLRWVEGADKFLQMEQKLKQNRQEQDVVITNTCILIKMILMKPNSFILPIEVWSNIFKYASYSFVPFDFEKFFRSFSTN